MPLSQTGFHPGPAPAFFNPADLPVAPDLLRQFLEATHQRTPDFQHLSTLVLQDAALCFRLLEFGQSLPTQGVGLGDIAEALSSLGARTLSSLGITITLSQAALWEKDGAGPVGFAKLWEGSLRCAHAARDLALLTDYHRPYDAYVAGLLHNLGRTLLLHRFPDRYCEILKGGFRAPVLSEIEKERFATTGPELAASLTRDWCQAPFFSDALLYQEEPAEAVIDAPPLVKLVNLAHTLSVSLEGADGRASAALLFNLDTDTIDSVKETARDRAAEAALLFNLDTDTTESVKETARDRAAEAALLFNLDTDTIDSVKETARDRAAEAAAAFNITDGDRTESGEEVRASLSRHVGSAAAMHGIVQQINLSSHLSPWSIMLRHLGLLFGLPRTLAFEYRPQAGTLNFIDSSFALPNVKDGLAVAVEPGRSLIAKSILRDRPLTFEGWDGTTPSYVIDRQLQRLLSAPGLFCIPLVEGGDVLGALVAGVDINKSRELNQQPRLIQQFARTCAQCLDSRRKDEVRQTEVLKDQRSYLQTQIRSLVHEASNPLGVIRNYLHLFSMKLEDRQEMGKQIAFINEEIDRVSRILDQMKDLQSTTRPGSGPVDINRLIKDLTSVWRDSLLADRNISDRLLLQKNIPPLQCCADSLKQVLINLVKNAVEAMYEGGTLTISSRAPVNVNGRPHVEISVADNGPGLPQAMLGKAFAPPEHSSIPGGRGLGLAIVGELVANMGGFISCSNPEGGGAEFILRIPRED